MKKIKIFYLVLTLLFISNSQAEKIILSKCDSRKDGFLKNEYILDLGQSLMIRNYIFDERTFNKHRITDLGVKKKIK